MTRSPLFYPMNRGGDSEAGGAADLQTDVMRFMAILSLCLVAIFALVQSIPLSPAPVAEPKPEQHAAPVTNEPVRESDKAIELVRPRIKRQEVRDDFVSLSRPPPTPVSVKPKPAPVAEPPIQSPEPKETGFTLRFENDTALTRLVERQVVGFYAIGTDNAFRMSIDGDAISFWQASIPGQFHEMDNATVPDSVRAAYRRSNGSSDIKWGVTLPANMSRDLNEFLTAEAGGSLVIAANGDIDLRH